ncbi:Transcriptional regulator, TetR family [Labilithrix luteola]|uniref:Transcriptional regulator, TetR family n=1 Tax=Labilithrix luteola TaxID=1391654 RepID=A0A0K1PU48_9BACT|nr:TetR/AcrR family transcriptional regulator [Labilithrix luteola]AKU96654.1 Transcriptional regulator, TetR family [Labilithrix luteola]
MARAKEFDREQALDRAMHVFWRKGYEGASLGELLEAMGIARQSLYDTFGDKHALYLAALERYVDRRWVEIHSCLDSAPSVKRAIRDLFDAIVDESDEEKRRGCLGISAAMEVALHDAVVAKIIGTRQKRIEELLFRTLERGRETGEIPKSKDARALARFLVGPCKDSASRRRRTLVRPRSATS